MLFLLFSASGNILYGQQSRKYHLNPLKSISLGNACLDLQKSPIILAANHVVNI